MWPKLSKREPRTNAMRSASRVRRREGCSWYGLVGSQTHAVAASASQNSNRPSKLAMSSRVM